MNRQQRLALFLVSVVLGAVLVPAVGGAVAGLVSSVFPVASSGTVAFESNSGVVVNYETGGADLAGGNRFPDANTVEINSSAGNITVSGSGDADVTVEDATGTWTNTSLADVQGTTVTFNPEDKAKISVEGEPEELDWQDYAVDDGTPDAFYSGTSGETELTFYGLPANTILGVVDVNRDTVLANATTDGSGTLTVTLPNSDHTIALQTGEPPEVSDLRPTGRVSTYPTRLNASISDTDFPNDEVNTTFYVNGNKVGEDSVTANGTVSTTTSTSVWNMGDNPLRVVANDSYDSTVEETTTVEIPHNLTIRNETRPSEIINQTTVSVKFFNGTQIFNRTTDDGVINMSGLPADKRYIVTADADGYNRRTVLIDDITEQQTVYLLNETLGVEVRFELKDRSGEFPTDSVLFVELPINQSGTTTYRTVVADRFGPNGVTAVLQEGERHRLRIRNPEQDVRVLGAFTPTVSETVVLEIGDVTIRNAADGSTYEWDAAYEEDGNGNVEISFDYADEEDATTDLRVRIFERGNESNEILDTTLNGPLGNASITQPLTSTQKNQTWVVKWRADRDGGEIEGRRVVGDDVNLGVPVDAMWRNTASVALIVIVGGAMGGISAPLAAIATALLGGVLWFVGWVPAGVGGGAVALALLIAVGFSVFRRR